GRVADIDEAPVAAQRPVGTGRPLSAPTIYRVAWLPTRAWLRTDTPALRSPATMSSTVFPCGTEASRAAPSKLPSGIAISSPRVEAARAALPVQPDTFMLHMATSRTIASGCGRAIANTGRPAG